MMQDFCRLKAFVSSYLAGENLFMKQTSLRALELTGRNIKLLYIALKVVISFKGTGYFLWLAYGEESLIKW